MNGPRAKTLFVSILLLLSSVPAGSTTRHLKIIHWNDLHSQIEPFASGNGSVGGFINLKRVVDSLREVAKEYGDACLVLDGGDEFQGTLVSTITKGKSAYQLLNLVGPDAVVLGNHEFDYGWANLRGLLHTTAHFPIVNANILAEDGASIARPYFIKRVGGLRVGIIGLTLESLHAVTLPENITGLTIKRYDDVLPGILQEIRTKSVDLVVLLTHIGVEGDSVLARKYPQIGVIVGGHSHTPLFHPLRVGHTIIVQAGSKGRWVGEADLEIDDDRDSVITSRAHLIEVHSSTGPTDRAATRAVEKLLKLVDSSYLEVIGTLQQEWKAGHEFNGNLSTFEAATLRAAFGADLGCMNHGGLRKSLAAGPIRLKDVYEINPFQNELVRVTITGESLRRALEWMLRGAGSEPCEFAGLRCVFDRAQKRITSVQIGEKELSQTATYTMITNVFVGTKLHAIFGLDSGEARIEHLGAIDDDVYATEIRKRRTIDGKSAEWVYFRN